MLDFRAHLAEPMIASTLAGRQPAAGFGLLLHRPEHAAASAAPAGASGEPRYRSFGRRAADAGDRRALVCEPKIILLDEPFEGLAPVIVHDFVKACRNLADAGQRPGGAESRCSR
jgi:hypothetical protein